MPRMLRWSAVAALTLAWLASSAAAQEGVTVSFKDGRVTLAAKNVPIRAVLAEWQRQGGTRFVNSERLPGAPVTLELTDVPEQQALAVLLRPYSGYMASPRRSGPPRPSAFDVVLVMPTLARATPAPAPSAPSSSLRPPAGQRPPMNRGYGRGNIQIGGSPDMDQGNPDVGDDPQDEQLAPGMPTPNVMPGQPGVPNFPGMPTQPPPNGDPQDASQAVPAPGQPQVFPATPGTTIFPGMVVPATPTPGTPPPKPPKPPGRTPDARPSA